jgi:4-oxalocrotonate tautomerase
MAPPPPRGFVRSRVRRFTNERWRNTSRRALMPLVTVKVIEGVFTPVQKEEMIHRLTETMVSIEGENLRPVTWVVVEEVKSGNWGVGGNALTTSDVRALMGGHSMADA